MGPLNVMGVDLPVGEYVHDLEALPHHVGVSTCRFRATPLGGDNINYAEVDVKLTVVARDPLASLGFGTGTAPH